MNIPDSIKEEVIEMDEQRNKRNTENVLLLAMSTLFVRNSNGKAETDIYKYVYEDANGTGEYVFRSDSQLVPGSKYLISYLDSINEKISRIIVINTNETLEKAKTKKDNAGNVYELEYSAYEHYKNQIIAFLKGQTNDNAEEHQIDTPYDNPETLFSSIAKKDKEDEGFLWDLAKQIKGDDPEKHINLYVDTQGGDRNAVVEINAVIELLRNRGVTVKKRIATDFNRDNDIQRIKVVDEQYRTYELFSAIQSFERFGIGNELVDFFQTKNDLINVVKTLTESIQLCDMNTFDKAVRRLPELINEESKESKIKIVKEDIYDNYKNIIDSIKSGKGIIFEEIYWCAQKGYLQQALTLIESKALKEIFCNGLMYWEYSDLVSDIRQKANGTWRNIPDYRISQVEAISYAKRSWETYINYSIISWCNQCITGYDYRRYNSDNERFMRDDEYQSAYINLEDLKESDIPDDYSSDDMTIKWKQDSNIYKGTISIRYPETEIKLFKFLRLHIALKNQRNTINHASTNGNQRYDYAVIKNAIDIYVELARQLLSGNSENKKIEEITDETLRRISE